MKINLEVNNLIKSPIDKISFGEIAEKVLKEQANFLEGKDVFLSVAFVSEEEIKKLNKKYRQKNSSTDVLSFSEFEDLEEIEKNKKSEIFLGELIICYHDIEKYVLEQKTNLEKEVKKVFVHGLLHLLGFKHGERMFFLQKEIVNKFSK